MSSSLLSSHLEQILLCANSIGDLQFPGPKAFTNALLAPHDITALIRDTEPHERALFSIAPPPVPSKTQMHQFSSAVSASLNSAQPRPGPASGPIRPPRRHTAVAAVLGGDMYRRIRDGGVGDQTDRYGRSRERSEVDVDLLLHGAEKLVSVYPIPGAFDRIARLRSRYSQLTANIAHYEERVASQSSQLNHMNQPKEYTDYYEPEDVVDEDTYHGRSQHMPSAAIAPMTAEDVRLEEDEIRALERKKKALEERVTGMEKDIGGLMR